MLTLAYFYEIQMPFLKSASKTLVTFLVNKLEHTYSDCCKQAEVWSHEDQQRKDHFWPLYCSCIAVWVVDRWIGYCTGIWDRYDINRYVYCHENRYVYCWMRQQKYCRYGPVIVVKGTDFGRKSRDSCIPRIRSIRLSFQRSMHLESEKNVSSQKTEFSKTEFLKL